MKKTFLLFTGLSALLIANAQQKDGTVIYERKINLHKTITDPQMRAMIPEYRTSQHMLLFSDSVSLYKAVPEDEAPDPFGGGNGRMTFRTGGDAGEMYKNFSKGLAIQSSEVGGRNFLIMDTIKQQPWKLMEETKQILGHTCYKATRKITQPVRRMMMMGGGGPTPPPTDTTQKAPTAKEVDVIAWYASDIITPAGPENFGQLPGVILQLDIENGTTVYTATQVKPAVDKKDLKEPKKGKVVTRAEYLKIMQDMMPSGPGGTFRFGG